MVDTGTAGTPASASVSALDRWLRLHVPRDRGDEELSLADLSADLDRAESDEDVTGIELTVDAVDSAEEMSAFLEALDDREVRIEKLVVEIE
jgi:hypothetical protein